MLVSVLGDQHTFFDRLGHGPRSRGICAALQPEAAVDEGVECRARKDVRAVPDDPARPRERDWARFKAHFEIDHR